jgi:hypothetical protein
MSFKGILGVLVLMLAFISVYTFFSMPEEKTEAVIAPEPFSFDLSVDEFGLIDSNSGKQTRAYLTSNIHSSGVENTTFELLLFEHEPKIDIYAITDYPSKSDKKEVLSEIKDSLEEYGFSITNLKLEEAMNIKKSIIILPTDAMPDRLSSGEILQLLEHNVIIFFGKSLDISIDQTASQSYSGDSLYTLLNISESSDYSYVSGFGGPDISNIGNGSILEYDNGYLVIYPDLTNNGSEIAQLILAELWQSERQSTVLQNTVSGNQTLTLFSSPMIPKKYFMRLLYQADSQNESKRGFIDFGSIEKPKGTLRLNEVTRSGSMLDYIFELHEDNEYPMRYDLSLQFIRDGEVIKTLSAKPAIIKTLAIDEGRLNANLTSGSYVVKLIDPGKRIHAAAYTHVPQIKIRLIEIIGSEHVFSVTKDGLPVVLEPVILTVNGKDSFELHTDKNGDARVSFMLSPGMHEFNVLLDGESATTYYEKASDNPALFYMVLMIAGSLFFIVLMIKSKSKNKWKIKSYQRPSSGSKTLRIPYNIFLNIFKMTQQNRAQGLPLSVSDLGIGLRRYATFKGTPIFITDSNIYRILDELVRKGHFLSYSGYFMPKEMVDHRPIEYWVIKRRLNDHFIENGEELPAVKKADFMFRDKMLHIWHDLDPKMLISLCKKADSVIIFPDAASKEKFRSMASRYNPDWMRVSLEIQYGRIYCQTIDEFLGRGSNGKS